MSQSPPASPPVNHSRSLARNAGVVGLATLASRILGFVRDLVVAFALGAGPAADAFFVAFRIPNLLRRLFAEGSLTMAFIPVFQQLRKTDGDVAAFGLARAVQVWLAGILGALTVLVVLAAEPVTALIAPGFTTPGDPRLTLAADLLAICFPYILLVSAMALAMGVLNSLGHFLMPALAPCMLNVALITAALVAHMAGTSVAHAMAWGVLAGGVLQLAMQQPALWKRGFTWRGPVRLLSPAIGRVATLMGPTVLGAAVYQINILLTTLLASLLPVGAVSYLYYADRLIQFPLGVFAVAVGTAALPSLATLAADRDDKGFDATLTSAIGLTLFIGLPSAAGLAGLAWPLIDTLFARGAFGAEAAAATAAALVAYTIGLPFLALIRPLVSGFYALQNTRTPVLVAMVCMALNIGLGAVAVFGLPPAWGHVGLALAVSASGVANGVLLYVLLTRKRATSLAPRRSLVVYVVLSAAVGVAAWGASLLGGWGLVFIPVIAACYIFACHALGMAEAHLFTSMIGGKLRRRLGM